MSISAGMKAQVQAIAPVVPSEQPSPPHVSHGIAMRRMQLVTEEQPPASTPGGMTPIWEPMSIVPERPTTSSILNSTRAPEELPEALEAEILATFVRPLEPGESHQVGNDNRERELRTLFEELSPLQAHHLRRRLELDRNSDPIAVVFRRLLAERRQRLRAFLADPRRGRVAH